MKKTNGTKGAIFKSIVAGSLSIIATMLLALPGQLSAGDTAQTVSFSLPTGDTRYGVAPIDVGATATSGNPVFIFVSGPAYVDRNGKVAVTGTGTVNVAGLALGDATYAQAWHVASIEIKKKKLVVTADDKTKVYGAANPALTVTMTGFVNGDTASSLSTQPVVTTAATNASGAGNVAITFSTNAADSKLNYWFEHNDGTLAITKAPLTIAAVNQTRTYGDENPDTGSVNGLRLREYHDISGTKVSDLTGNAKYPAGFDKQAVADYFEWPQTGDINTKPGGIADNYGIELAGYITPTETAEYQFWISADDGAELWLSTDDDPANLVKIANEPEWNGTRNYPTGDRRGNADAYSITVTASSTHSTTNLVAAIDTAATALATATTADTDAKAAAAAAKVTSDASKATWTALQSIADEVDPTQAVKDDATAKAAAATTAATNLTTSQTAQTAAKTALTDAQTADTAALNVVVDKTNEYYAALSGGDATAITAALTAYQTAVAAWETTSAAVATAKTNLETADADVAAKQTAKDAADTASAAAAKLASDTAATAEEIAAAASAKTTYDTDAAATATADATAATAATTLTSAQATYDAAVAAALASIATEIATDINAKTANSNKSTASASGAVITLTAAEADTVITVAASAGNGGSDAGLSAVAATSTASTNNVAQVSTITLSGRVETGDSITVNVDGARKDNASPYISLTAGQSYYVKGLMKEGGGGDNFAVTWIKKGADAPAADALPIPGSVLTPASSIDYTYTGFVLDQTASDLTKSPTGTIAISETTGVGEYDITIGGAESSNYEITHTNGKVTVGPATLTVTGDNKEVFETEALPALTYTYSGFLNGDTASTNIVTTASSVTTAADNMTPGDYPIVTSGAVAVNYTINNVDGVMKIKTVAKPKVTGLTVTTNNPLEGDNVTYTVTSTGDLVVYKWYKGSELVQTGGNTYTLNDVSVSDSARIQVFAENFKGKSRKLSSLKIKERLNQVFLVVGANSKPVEGANSIKIREYHDIGGSELSGLTSSSKYPDSPDAVKSASKFESETNIRDNYGLEASGFLHPNKTGDYTFYIASDDNSQVWLSTDEDPANQVKIAQETSWRGVRDYDQAGDADGGEAKSAKIALEAGKKYSIKVLMKEGGGGDNMALAWSFGDEAAPADGAEPIGGEFLSQNGSNDNHPDYVKDDQLKKVLESQGYSVIYVGPNYPVNSAIDASNAAFVVVSSTADSATAAGYANTTAPLINLAPTLQDDLGFIGKIPNDSIINELTGTLGSISAINITNPGHPLAAGLAAGTQQVVGDPVLADLTAAGDTVVPSSTNSPDAEQAANAIDNNSATKYLNFDGKNNTSSGLTITTSSGGIARGLKITSANDAPERDPATYIISGSNDNTTFTEIARGGVPSFANRFETKSLSFDNATDYKHYKIDFPTTATSNGCCMQVAEIEILGYPASAGTEIDANWGTPNGNAIVIADLGGNTDKAAIYAYEIGAIMGNGTAATGRRVNLHTSTAGIGSASATGLALINAAANWAMEFDVLGDGGNLDMIEGESLVLDGRVNGENISTQWYKDGVAIAGGSTLTLGALDKSEAGTYTIRATDPDAAWANRFKEVSYKVSVGDRGKEAVLVTGSNGLTSADEKIKSKLKSKGYYVIESASGNTTASSVAGKSLVVISPSASATGEVVYNNSGSREGKYYATTKEFGDQVELGLSNRFIDSLSFEYYGDFTADGDEKAVARIYANDGGGGNTSSTSHGGYGNLPGTLLYESDAFSIASGFNSVTISGLLVEAPGSITWTVDFSGVGNVAGNRAGLVFYDSASTGSSFDDFVLKSNSTEVLYETDQEVLYEAYYNAGTEFGDQIKLTSVGPTYDINFEAYAEISAATAATTATFRIYANDGASLKSEGGWDANKPDTLLYESGAIALKEGYNTYSISDVSVNLTTDVTWTVEFDGVAGTAGSKAALILAGTDAVGSSQDDFWQKGSSGWDLYQSSDSDQNNDFSIELIAHTGAGKNVVYNATKDTLYEAYYKSGTEFGDEIVLSDTSSSSEITFEAYAELTNAPATGTAKLRIYANDGAVTYGDSTTGATTKQPSTLLYESADINLIEGYNSYTVSGITADLPRNITWTVEFSGVTGDQLNSGNNAALILGGNSVIGTSHDDFWQKDSSGWTIYRSGDAKQNDNFSARVIAHTGGNDGWSYYQSADAETVNNFGAKVTAGVKNNLLTSVDVPMIVFGSGFQSNVKYTGAGSSNSGVAGGSKLTITNSDHGLAAGFAAGNVGLVILGKGDAEIGWGIPQGDATVVATLAGDSSKATIYGYEEGGALANGIAAPERRSFVGLTADLFTKLDGDATRLISAAIDWTGGTGFSAKPSGAELLTGENVTLSATGYGPGDLGYQWKKDGANLEGKTGSTLTLENVVKADGGNYSVVVTSGSGDTAQTSSVVKVFSLPNIDFKAPGAGVTTATVTHDVKIWALGGVDKVDVASAKVSINGVDVTANGKVTSNVRGIQFKLKLTENTTDAAGDFAGIESLTAGANNAMTVTFSYTAGGSSRVFSNEWSYTLYDATSSSSSDVAKMAIHQIFEQEDHMYVVWPGSDGLVLERNSDCKGGVWETLPNTVGKGLHIEPNCGTKAFFRLVRVKE